MNNSLRTGVALLGGVGLAVLMTLFTWTLGNSQLAKPLNAEAAQRKAQEFLQAVGLKIPHVAMSTKEVEGLPGEMVWEVTWGGVYTIKIHPLTGEVCGFYNNQRIWEQVKRIGRTGKTFYQSREEALQYITRLAKQFGLPRSAVLKRFWCYADGESPHADANKGGTVGAIFCEKPFGYPSLPFCPENGMSVEVGSQDGTLISFSRQWNAVQVESHTLSFPKDKAVAKAKQVYAEYYRTRTSPHRGTYKGKVELGYVLPNGMFGGKRYPEQVPVRVRLAWAVYFGEEAVWIDAGDGSILGGAILK